MSSAELEKRVIALEDIEAIKKLKAEYCDICDDGHNPDRITAIFAEDGVWESDRHGKFVGHDAIRAQFARFGKAIRFSQHMITNPMITVSGDTATARWYFLSPMDFRGEPRWSFVRYDDEYVRLADGWKFRHTHVTLRMDAPHLGGWPTAGSAG